MGEFPIAGLFPQKKHIPMCALERQFSTLSAEQAHLAYAQALAATNYIRPVPHICRF